VHEIVARQATPRREVLLDGGLHGVDLQELPRLERIDVTADEQQQAAPAVEVASVEAVVGPMRVDQGARASYPLRRRHLAAPGDGPPTDPLGCYGETSSSTALLISSRAWAGGSSR